jgi:hypothetical protein
MITNGQRLINRLIEKKFRTSTIFAYLAGDRSEAVMNELSRVGVDLTNHTNDHVKMVFKNYIACVLGGYDAWPCARLLRILISINSEPELLFMDSVLRAKVGKELSMRIVATPDQFSTEWMTPLLHTEEASIKEAREFWYSHHARKRLKNQTDLVYPEDLTKSCLTLAEEQFAAETKLSRVPPDYFPVQRKIFFKGKLWQHGIDEPVDLFVKRVTDQYYLFQAGSSKRTEIVQGDVVSFIRNHITWHAEVKEMVSMDEYRVFQVYQPHYHGGQYWNLFYLEEANTLSFYAHQYFAERFNRPYKKFSITQLEKLSNERADYHGHTPEFMSVDWKVSVKEVADYREARKEKSRTQSARTRELRDARKETAYEAQHQEKLAFGLYGVYVVDMSLREIELCLYWMWKHEDLEGVMKQICRRLGLYSYTSESRKQQSSEVGGDGKATNEEQRLSSLTLLEEQYPDQQILVMRTTKDGFVRHEFGDSSQVHVYFAVRSPDYGLNAWVSRTVPMYPGVEGQAPGTVHRSVGYYEEYTMKRFFPCLSWRQWTVFYLSASSMKAEKGLLWFSVLGDGFSWHVPFSFETCPEVKASESEMARLWFDSESWVLTEKVKGVSQVWNQLKPPTGRKRVSQDAGPVKKRRRKTEQ